MCTLKDLIADSLMQSLIFNQSSINSCLIKFCIARALFIVLTYKDVNKKKKKKKG